VVYDRQYDDDTLSFEASGALKEAALVMRDRETDSWWSVMTAEAIDGTMKGAPLKEMAVGVKTTWGEWRKLHPDSRVLLVDGKTHEPENAYQDYYDSDRTYREIVPDDDRLPGKTPIFAFRWDGEPVAVPHSRIEGGTFFRPDGDDGAVVLIHRVPDAPLFASTRAAVLPAEMTKTDDPEGLAAKLDAAIAAGTPGVTRVAGFDTYWYTWAAQNPGTLIVGE
jgi:hypothetical protein